MGCLGAAGTLALLAASCGGTQAPAPAVLVSDAATDAGVQPSEDPCVIQSSYTYKPITGFEGDRTLDLAASPNITNPNTNPSYTSFDLTGFLFGCNSTIDPAPTVCAPAVEHVYAVDAKAPLTVSGIQCTTGFNAVPEDLPPDDPGHCLIDGGKAGQGAHLRATGLGKWGMNMGIDLRQNCYVSSTVGDSPNIDASAFPNQPCYFDARGWTGISFWARLGSSDSATNAILTIGDPLTAGVLGGTYPFNAQLCGDAPCDAGAGPPLVHGPQQCDPFGKAFTLSSSWQFYRIPFSEMVQKGYGLPEQAPDLAHFLQLKINLSLGQLGAASYDVWVNDFAFYK
jgi:hypothetical protein